MKKTLLLSFLAALIMVGLIITGATAQAWQPNPKYVKSAKDSTRASVKAEFQCYGTTQKGQRCKRHVTADHSYCYQHQNQGK